MMRTTNHQNNHSWAEYFWDIVRCELFTTLMMVFRRILRKKFINNLEPVSSCYLLNRCIDAIHAKAITLLLRRWCKTKFNDSFLIFYDYNARVAFSIITRNNWKVDDNLKPFKYVNVNDQKTHVCFINVDALNWLTRFILFA